MGEKRGGREASPASRSSLTESWDTVPYLRLVAPVLCVAWEAMMFTRVVFAHVDAAFSTPSTQLVLLVLMAVGCVALFLRYRLPVVSVLLEACVCLVASAGAALAYLYFLPLVALYACLARAPRREAIAGAAIGVASVLLSAVVDGLGSSPSGASAISALSSQGVVAALAGIGYPLILVVVAALFSRFRWERLLEAERAERQDAARREQIARASEERDRALAKSRIAAELHDSVGHDLTAIIALSEGLAGVTGDEQLDQALASINCLARSGLTDTRRAVRALAGEASETGAGMPASGSTGPWSLDSGDEGRHVAGLESGELPGAVAASGLDVADDADEPDAVGEPDMPGPSNEPDVLAVSVPTLRRWDEVSALLGPVRMSGVAAALTETGARPDDPEQADLAYRICREGVTNALRHAAGLSRLTVSIDHDGDGSAHVAVRDDGNQTSVESCEVSDAAALAGGLVEVGITADAGTGMGLAHLSGEVSALGGSLVAGPAEGSGWQVLAYLPATSGDYGKGDDSHA